MQSLCNLTDTTAVRLLKWLSDYKAMRKFKLQISQLRGLTRSCDKTFYRILKQGPGNETANYKITVIIKPISVVRNAPEMEEKWFRINLLKLSIQEAKFQFNRKIYQYTKLNEYLFRSFSVIRYNKKYQESRGSSQQLTILQPKAFLLMQKPLMLYHFHENGQHG